MGRWPRISKFYLSQINTFGDKAFLSLFLIVNLHLFRQQWASLIANGCTGVNLPFYPRREKNTDDVLFATGEAIHVEFLVHRRTVISEQYIETFRKPVSQTNVSSPSNRHRKSTHKLFDSRRLGTAARIDHVSSPSIWIRSCPFRLFFLFPHLKDFLKGQRFESDADLKALDLVSTTTKKTFSPTEYNDKGIFGGSQRRSIEK